MGRSMALGCGQCLSELVGSSSTNGLHSPHESLAIADPWPPSELLYSLERGELLDESTEDLSTVWGWWMMVSLPGALQEGTIHTPPFTSS